MGSRTAADYPLHPTVRVYLFGEFILERLTPSHASTVPSVHYELVAHEEWQSRRPAQALFKVLLCRARRRASRDELLEALWPQGENLNLEHAFDSAVSVLRKVLRTDTGESLLKKTRNGGVTIFSLPDQQQLWVDVDAFERCIEQAMRAERSGEDALPLWEAAQELATGEFLEDDRYSSWAQGRRQIIDAARHRCLHRLADLYLARNMPDQAEALLQTFLIDEPTDEDALCRLMLLLQQQGRYQEALTVYEQGRIALEEDGLPLAIRTRTLAEHIRQQPLPQESRAISAFPGSLCSSVPALQKAQGEIPVRADEQRLLFPDMPPALVESAVLQAAMQAYEDVLTLAWEAFYTSSAQRATSTVEHWLLHLTQQINTTRGMSDQLMALRCRFLQLQSVIARDHTDFPKALNAINEAITLAFQLQDAELVASSLYRRAKVWAAQQQYDLAVKDLEAVLPYARRSRDPLRCYIAMLLAEMYSRLAPGDARYAKKSLTLLDEVDRTVRTHGVLEGDGSFVKVDIAGLYMIRGDVLGRSGQRDDAREAFLLVRRSLPKAFTRWQGNLCISEAQLSLAQRDLENSCQLAHDALDIFQATDSQSGAAKVRRLYRDLWQAYPAHAQIKELGERLDIQRREPLTTKGERR